MLKSDLLRRALSDIPQIARDDEDRRIADELLDDINAGRAKIADVSLNGKLIGSLVYEIRGVLFIVHAVRCDNIETDCAALAFGIAKDIARHNGCRRIICDTKRSGVVTKMLMLGCVINSVSLRFDL